MIIPESRPDEQRKSGLLALGATVAVVLLMVFVLTAAQLPSADDMRAAYRQVDLTVFNEPPPEEEEPEEEQEPEEVAEEEAPAPVVEATQPQQPQRIEVDLAALDFAAPEEPAPQTPEQRDRADASPEAESPQLSLNELGDLSALDALEGTGNNLPSASGRRGAGGGDGGLGVEGGLGEGLGGGLGEGLGGGGALGVEGRDAPSGDLDVGEVDLSEFGPGGPPLDNLGPYLRSNRVELPDAVKRLMQRGNWTSDLLTTKVNATMPSGRRVEMYLMFKESLQELHILVVDGQNASYIIDRARQGQARVLRQGTVSREGGVITVIQNEQVEATASRTQPYYQTFSDWWARQQ
jgi:hypothetical protein